MFLDVLRRRNPEFVETAMAFHQAGRIPANSYVLDLDAVEENANLFSIEARKRGLKTFAMTKQAGRNSGFCDAIKKGGIDRIVAVDMACALACGRSGTKTGHLGHLVQIPRHESDAAARRVRPDYWTVFSEAKAQEAAAASRAAGRRQKLLARVQGDGDLFYRGHEGGFPAGDIVAVAKMLDSLDGADFAGITTFPALLFDQEAGSVQPTPNLSTLTRARECLRRAGRKGIEVNAPGTTSSIVLGALAEAGATQCEPGNGLHGTTPLHAVEDLPERPAILYLTEVSHCHGGRAYCFGGGLYIDPVFSDYDVKAIVSPEPTVSTSAIASVEIPPPHSIDYYGMIDMSGSAKPASGDTVVFGFRGQAFVTRALVVGLSGVSTGAPRVKTIEDTMARPVNWKAQEG